MSAHKMLVAVDESANAMHAVEVAGELARALGAKVALVHAVDVRAAILPDVGIASEEILKSMREAGRHALELANKRLGFEPAESYLVEGVVADELIAAAERWGAGLIVVGTHGRSGLSRLLMGSTAENILRHSKVPVLVVPVQKPV